LPWALLWVPLRGTDRSTTSKLARRVGVRATGRGLTEFTPVASVWVSEDGYPGVNDGAKAALD